MTENKRIIKFRAWGTKYKVMIEGFAIYDNADHLGMSLSDAEQFYTPEQIEADSDHFCGGDGDWIFMRTGCIQRSVRRSSRPILVIGQPTEMPSEGNGSSGCMIVSTRFLVR